MSERDVLKTLTCKERNDMFVDAARWSVASTLTDPDGRYGEPKILTLWMPKGMNNNYFVGVEDVIHFDWKHEATTCEHHIVLSDWRNDD